MYAVITTHYNMHLSYPPPWENLVLKVERMKYKIKVHEHITNINNKKKKQNAAPCIEC